MKRTIAIVSILGGMVLGATVLRDLVPNTEAQTAPVVAPSAAPATTFNETRALLENEKNSVGVIKNNQDGVVFVTVESNPQVAQSGSSGSGAPNGQTDPFGQFFGGQGSDIVPGPSTGSGSGFFVNDAGYILTN